MDVWVRCTLESAWVVPGVSRVFSLFSNRLLYLIQGVAYYCVWVSIVLLLLSMHYASWGSAIIS